MNEGLHFENGLFMQLNDIELSELVSTRSLERALVLTRRDLQDNNLLSRSMHQHLNGSGRSATFVYVCANIDFIFMCTDYSRCVLDFDKCECISLD